MDLKDSFAESALKSFFQQRNKVSFILIKHPLYVQENWALKQPENQCHSGTLLFVG